MANLSLDSIIEVTVNVSAAAPQRSEMNTALLLSENTVISTTDRVKVAQSMTEVQDLGFGPETPEYQAALVYFGQEYVPSKVVIGAVGSSEDWASALADARVKNTDWYVVVPIGADKTDITGLAAQVEGLSPASTMIYRTEDADVLSATADNVLDALKKADYHRSMGIYSTSDYAEAAVAGYAMGANTGLADSAYTLFAKQLDGVEPEDLTSTQVSGIEGYNGNVYIRRGVYYEVFEHGVMADGTDWDEVYYLDLMVEGVIRAYMDLLQRTPKIPQTDTIGAAMIQTALVEPLEEMRTVGFIGAGVWTARTVGTLTTGTALPRGYVIQIGSFADQDQADREAHICPPVTICVKLAGSVHSVAVTINVNR